jgi:hypothetical protein
MSIPGRRSFLDPMAHLKHRWLEVLAVAAAAVDSAAQARLIESDESRAHSRTVATERMWLETVDWAAVAGSRASAV